MFGCPPPLATPMMRQTAVSANFFSATLCGKIPRLFFSKVSMASYQQPNTCSDFCDVISVVAWQSMVTNQTAIRYRTQNLESHTIVLVELFYALLPEGNIK
jgi:hypothetical protein